MSEENQAQEQSNDQAVESKNSFVRLEGVLGIKSGMTQIFKEDGRRIPVTVIDLVPQVITQIKTEEKDGYSSVQVGAGPKKDHRSTKPEKGHVKKTGESGFYRFREWQLKEGEPAVGASVMCKDLKPGDLVDVAGISKGKGFQGGIKRWGFRGITHGHGAGPVHRSIGSTGNRKTPGRVFKGKKMPGHMGAKRVTARNCEVVELNLEKMYLVLKGSIPGSKNGWVEVKARG